MWGRARGWRAGALESSCTATARPLATHEGLEDDVAVIYGAMAVAGHDLFPAVGGSVRLAGRPARGDVVDYGALAGGRMVGWEAGCVEA